MKTIFFYFLCVLFGQTILMAQEKPVIVRVIPKEIDDVLINPGMGFMTFQRFNGDELNQGTSWTEGLPIVYQKFNGNLTNKNHPQATIAYFRVNWRFLETAPKRYNWAMIDSALRTAAERGQTLMLRISPYESGPIKDVPAWYREMVGKETPQKARNWRVDPEDPRFVQYFGGMIKAMGQRYDGHPDLESVDISFAGFWGEGEGTHLLTDVTRIALINAYVDNFKKTTLTWQPLNGDAPDPGMLVRGTAIAASWPDGRNNGTGLQMRNLGWRLDCLGDMRTGNWKAMIDNYPQDIIRSGMSEAWRKAPVTLEICGTFGSWLQRQKYTKETVEYSFEQALKWHVTSFNAKSSPVPEEWRPLVDNWLKKMGYRFVLRRFTYPSVVMVHGQLPIESWWDNKGVAPVYKEYKFALRLKNSQRTEILLTSANLLEWLPGDIIQDEKLYIPYNMPVGTYDVEIGIISPATLKPVIKLAIEGVNEDGWYPMGKIEVKDNK